MPFWSGLDRALARDSVPQFRRPVRCAVGRARDRFDDAHATLFGLTIGADRRVGRVRPPVTALAAVRPIADLARDAT